jgi:hypothetical protein
MPLATVFIDPESQEPTTIKREQVEEGIKALLKLPKVDDPDGGEHDPERWAAYAEVDWDDVLPPVGDYHMVSEVSLKAAVHALQNIATQGRCHYSRSTAKGVLEAIGLSGDLPTDPDGKPERVSGHAFEILTGVQNHYQSDGN